MDIGTWFKTEEQKVAAWFSNEEAMLVQYFGPLFKEILAQAEALGQGDIKAGLQILTDATTQAVAAGVTAIASGTSAVTAAETTFAATVVTEGKTAINNAEAGLIKAGVAIAQQAASAVANVLTPAPQTP